MVVVSDGCFKKDVDFGGGDIFREGYSFDREEDINRVLGVDEEL